MLFIEQFYYNRWWMYVKWWFLRHKVYLQILYHGKFYFIILVHKILSFFNCEHFDKLHTWSLSTKCSKFRICFLSRCKFIGLNCFALANSKLYLYRFVRIYWIYFGNFYNTLFYHETSLNSRKNENTKFRRNVKKYSYDYFGKLGNFKFRLIFFLIFLSGIFSSK